MQNLIEVTMANNSKLYIENAVLVSPNNSDSLLIPAASGTSVIKQTEAMLKKSFEQIKEFSDHIATAIRNSSACPDEFDLEFGVKFSAEAGIVISSLNSEANVTIHMKWTNKQS